MACMKVLCVIFVGTVSGRMRGPAPPPMPPPQSPMRGGVPSGALEYPGARPVPAGPMMFVPAGAQPPQVHSNKQL